MHLARAPNLRAAQRNFFTKRNRNANEIPPTDDDYDGGEESGREGGAGNGVVKSWSDLYAVSRCHLTFKLRFSALFPDA